jgi:predicted amidohydrolase YtcJ
MNTSKDFTAQMLVDSLKAMPYKTGDGDSMVRIGAFKITLDGGILTGTAYQRQPWGNKAREIFGIDDPDYRGIVNYSRDDLFRIVKAANDLNWKFTAHCTGGGGVDLLLDVFDEVNKAKAIHDRRFSIIHGNFFTDESIKKMRKLNVCADMQPAWFYKDADAMNFILPEQVMETFHPYKSLRESGVIVNGGSDHMVKWDANTSVNPYNPFLAMWTMITRMTERGNVILPSQAISRQEAIRAYTINNAYGSFEENLKGSIEAGKLADMIVLSDDILTCPVDQLKNIESDLTLLGGKVVYSKP